MIRSLLEKLKSNEFTARVVQKLRSNEFIARVVQKLRSNEFIARTVGELKSREFTTRVAEKLKSYGFTAPVEDTYSPSDQVEAFTRKLTQYAAESDLVLFNGQWLTAEEARIRYRRLQWESTLKFVEVVVLFIFLFFVVLMPFTFLGLLGGLAA